MRVYFVISVIVLSISPLHSQEMSERNFEFSLGTGSTYLYGDFPARRARYAFANQDFVFVADARKYVIEGVSWGASASYFTCNGASDMKSRNYQFQSKLFSVTGFGAADIISFLTKKCQKLDVRLSVNSGIVHAYVPFYEFPLNSGRPDGTDKLKKNCLGMLYGIGLGCRVNLSARMGIRLEGTYNFTTTDFLDGFSPYDSKHNDAYIQGILSMYFRLPAHIYSKHTQKKH